GNAARSEMRFPQREFILADGERHMQLALASMARNGTTGQSDGLCRFAFAKHQKNITPGHRIGGQPLVAIHRFKPEHALVESARTLHVLRMNCRLQNAIEFRHVRSRLALREPYRYLSLCGLPIHAPARSPRRIISYPTMSALMVEPVISSAPG